MIRVLCLRASNGGEKYVVKINESMANFSTDRLIGLLARPHRSQYRIQSVYQFACEDDSGVGRADELASAFEKLYNAVNYRLDYNVEFETLWRHWAQ
jgi:hypothetical protein